MDLVALIALSFMLPIPSGGGIELLDSGLGVAMTANAGDGEPIATGSLVTVSYVVKDGLGHELANSNKRGMPFTFQFGDRTADPMFSAAVEGMAKGGERTVWIPWTAVGPGVGGIVPPRTDLQLWVHVESVTGLKASPKVKSGNAKGASGTLAVPGAAGQHGPARTQNPL